MEGTSPTSPNRLWNPFAPVDALWLALFRIGFGACMVWQAWSFFSKDEIHNYFIEPTHHFTFIGFDWVKPWPGDLMYLHCYVLGVAAICIMLGFYYRTACAVFFLGFTQIFLIDKSWYLNHHYLICLLAFLGVLLPANCRLSIDAWRYPKLRSDTVPRWCLWLLRFQLGVPYFYGGLAKINRDWIYGEPMRTWLGKQKDFPVLGQYFDQEWCIGMFVWGGMLLDLLVVPCLLWKRTRVPALILITLFHALNTGLFNIGIFPWLMLIATPIVFFPPATIATVLKRFGIRTQELANPALHNGSRQKLLVGFLSVYVCWQVLMPLRHHFYPGNTAFTRLGHHFSWRMKLNVRERLFRFARFDPETKVSRPVSHENFAKVLTGYQEIKLRDPDSFLLVAKWLAAQKPESDNEIRAKVLVALNTRDPIEFFDPELDLTSVKRTAGPQDWITLYPEPRRLSGEPKVNKLTDEQQRAGPAESEGSILWCALLFAIGLTALLVLARMVRSMNPIWLGDAYILAGIVVVNLALMQVRFHPRYLEFGRANVEYSVAVSKADAMKLGRALPLEYTMPPLKTFRMDFIDGRFDLRMVVDKKLADAAPLEVENLRKGFRMVWQDAHKGRPVVMRMADAQLRPHTVLFEEPESIEQKQGSQ